MKNFIQKWKKKSLFSKISDFVFVAFIIALIIPVSRTAIIAGVNNIKTKIIPPKINDQVKIKLTENDYNWQLTDINGNIVSFKNFKNKIIFINFWATWCAPCIGEMPEIQNFYDDYKNNPNIVFIIASTEKITKIKKFINDKNYTFPVYSIKSKIPQKLYSKSIPTSLLINKNGGIVLHQKGAANWSSNKMYNAINKLIDK